MMPGDHLQLSQPPAVSLTTCKRGHALVGDNLRHHPRRGYRICVACLREAKVRYQRRYPERIKSQREAWRAANPEKAATMKLESQKRYRDRASKDGTLYFGYTKNVLQAVGRERLEAAFETVRRTGQMADIYPVIGSVGRWRAIRLFYPKIANRMDAAWKQGRVNSKVEIIKPAKPAIIRLAAVDLLDRINAVVPRGLPRDQRQDIVSDMVEAVFAGHIRPDAIAQHVAQFVRASFRSDHNKFGPLSLDLPAFREGDTPLIETIDKGLWQ
ncbi:hypothetical protein [Bradyrhizobium sp. C9]|uniref:hypothetical protein n=1 Tax=Bradyrhizobium sp. C9 TaxID=142585 RepID=UPI000BE8CF45|nr:hypothetical protein [Bradyrhizobium sp. C9]PDT74142.1 hypothetical protein CO675_27105 [Bradyrhizobium sp. C9]